MFSTEAFRKRLKPLLDGAFSAKDALFIDLSTDNAALNSKVGNLEDLDAFIMESLHQKDKKWAIGGYLEKRSLYDAFRQFRHTSTEKRNIHLGLDLWLPANTSLFLPFEGVVHSTNFIEQPGDYGGLLILKHQFEGTTFHTLYGHLSHQSVASLNPGQRLFAGNKIGEIGRSSENGNWPPHLHLQVILNLGTYYDDYPGVCAESEMSFFAANCPNPNFLLI